VRDANLDDLSQLFNEFVEHPYDLAKGPLFRILLLRLSPERHVVWFVMHHIIADGWSVGILGRDMQALYAAQLQHSPSGLPSLPIQYADYATWHRSQSMEDHRAYWFSSLTGYVGPFDLAPNRPQQAGGTWTARTLKRTIPVQLSTQLGIFSNERQASLFMVLLTGVAMLVYLRTRQADLCIGTMVAGREQRDLEDLIGNFVNLLPLRLDLSGDITGDDLLNQTRQVVLDGLTHQAVPFPYKIAVPSEALPVPPILVRHDNYPKAEIQHWAGGLQARQISSDTQRNSRMLPQLDLSYYGDANELLLDVRFAAERFDEEDIKGLLLEMESLLFRLVNMPDAPLSWLLDIDHKGDVIP
jgi:hypothetical protein